MPFNRNLDEERRVVLAARLSRWRGHVLVVSCDGLRCHGARRVPVEALLPRWEALTVAEAIARLRCRMCGCEPSGVVLRRLVTGGRPSRADLILHLLGPGTAARR